MKNLKVKKLIILNYNLDKLVYTYQLYFYEKFGSVKIENNSYVSEYIVNKT